MNMRIAEAVRRSAAGKLVFFVGLGAVAFSVVYVSAQAKTTSPRQAQFQKALHKELHPAEPPKWSEFGGFEGWAKKEKERLEPIVLEILRGDRDDVPWQYAVYFVARHIPTTSIRDVVSERMQPILAREQVNGEVLTVGEHGLLAQLLLVLAEGYDKRAVKPLNRLIAWPECTYGIGYDYLMALRKVGDATSIEALRDMPLRKTNERIDRMAGLTEKIIEARVAGRVFPPETAPKELRTVTLRFLRACEAADLQAYVGCFPWGFHEGFDEDDMHEFLDGEHGQPALAAIHVALEEHRTFELDRDNLQAKLVCDDRYLVEFIYEVDGWKVMNIRPIRTDRSKQPSP